MVCWYGAADTGAPPMNPSPLAAPCLTRGSGGGRVYPTPDIPPGPGGPYPGGSPLGPCGGKGWASGRPGVCPGPSPPDCPGRDAGP